MANGALFLPTRLSMVRARTSAPPVFSSMVPMMVPATITIPMLVSVEPNPDAMTSSSPGTALP